MAGIERTASGDECMRSDYPELRPHPNRTDNNGHMDTSTLPTPVVTGFDALTQGISALLYLAIGLAAWARAQHDVRTRIFLAFSLANVLALMVPVLAWVLGMRDTALFPRSAAALLMAGLGLSALLLFHFTQVFPRKRPWIRGAGIQMSVAYLLAPIAIAALIRFAPPTLAEVQTPYIIGFVVFGFPLLVLLGFVLPIAAIVSLLRSFRDARLLNAPIARPLAMILVSQIAGGMLAIVFGPVIATAAAGAIVTFVLKAIIWLLALLTPVAFAAAVWQYDLLAIDPE